MRRALGLLLALTASGCTLFNGPLYAPGAPRIDCATAAVVGLQWTAAAAGAATPPGATGGYRPAAFRVERDGAVIGTTRDLYFADTSVSGAASYQYVIDAVDRAGHVAASASATVTTALAGRDGDAPYCASPVIRSMTWDWEHGYRAAEGSDLWSTTWGLDGNVYTFFGDGGGFGGDDHLGRTSFGIAVITGRPPPTAGAATNLYGGLAAPYPSRFSGKVRSLIAVGADFYAIAGIYRPGDAKYGRPPPISGSPDHVEIVYSRGNAHAWQDSGWTFCSGAASEDGTKDTFCPSGFVNFGPAYRGALDGYVYLFGGSPRADARADGGRADGTARTYLARVPRGRILRRAAYRYFAGVDAHSKPVWSDDADRMQAVFTDRNESQPGCGGRCSMAGSLEDAVYDAGLQRFIGVAQADSLAQTAFYDAPHPWGPWTTIAYSNVEAASGNGGWGNLSLSAGGSLGVHPVNAWTSADGLTLWMVYSSDGKAPEGALYPPAGSALDAFNLVRVELAVTR